MHTHDYLAVEKSFQEILFCMQTTIRLFRFQTFLCRHSHQGIGSWSLGDTQQGQKGVSDRDIIHVCRRRC